MTNDGTANTILSAESVFGLWELFVRYNCRADVRRPFAAKTVTIANLLGDAGVLVGEPRQHKAARSRSPDATVTARELDRIVEVTRKQTRRSRVIKQSLQPSNGRLNFEQFVRVLRAVAARCCGIREDDNQVVEFLQLQILEPVLFPSRHAELLTVLHTAYESSDIVSLYRRLRSPIVDILHFYAPGGCSGSSKRHTLNYEAFLDFCNDFQLQTKQITRVDLGTVYAVAMRGAGVDVGLDCPGVFDALLLVVRS